MTPFFENTGVHVLVDGQFGSTGKGAFASFLAKRAAEEGKLAQFDGAISSSGPNSGHTSYFGHSKIVLKQLPTFAAHAQLLGYTMPVYLSAGAIIDPNVLREEALAWPQIPIYVHPNAALVNFVDKGVEKGGTIAAIASTQSGTGAGLARKILRHPDAVIGNPANADLVASLPRNVSIQQHRMKPENGAYFMEVAQGFSLGLNSEFYPHVTSRECTVMQGIADARIPPRWVSKTYVCFRTHPIRVGNLGAFSSGGWYKDQVETTWEEIGVKAELTTVTKRVRRVATFSVDQFVDAIRANDPDWIAINFLNYYPDQNDRAEMIDALTEMRDLHHQRYGRHFGIVGGYGPNAAQWKVVND